MKAEEIDRFYRYPRTPHLYGSGLALDDSEKEYISFSELFGKFLVIEEKVDGSCSAISFNSNGDLQCQCRGHFLLGCNDWPEFDQFKVWASTWKNYLFDIIDTRFIMYGEYINTFHSVYYDNLPHFFMEFDIYDKENKYFLSTLERQAMISKSDLPIHSVRVIKEGVFNNKEEIMNCVGKSSFVTVNSVTNLEKLLRKNHLDEKEIQVLINLNKERLMEGLYVKWEDGGVVKGRYKYVRPIFVQSIKDYGKHWLDRKSIPNSLSEDANMFKLKGIK